MTQPGIWSWDARLWYQYRKKIGRGAKAQKLKGGSNSEIQTEQVWRKEFKNDNKVPLQKNLITESKRKGNGAIIIQGHQA